MRHTLLTTGMLGLEVSHVIDIIVDNDVEVLGSLVASDILFGEGLGHYECRDVRSLSKGEGECDEETRSERNDGRGQREWNAGGRWRGQRSVVDEERMKSKEWILE